MVLSSIVKKWLLLQKVKENNQWEIIFDPKGKLAVSFIANIEQ